MRTFDEDPTLAQDHNPMCRQLEDLLREADHRSLGGFNTEDTKFALQVRESLVETLRYMDRVENTISEIIENSEHTIDAREDEISNLLGKLRSIRDWVEDQRRLRNVIDIIEQDDGIDW